MTDDAPPETPLLAPWIGWLADGRAALFYADSRGQLVRLPLDSVALARLGLAVAEAQAAICRAYFAEPAPKANCSSHAFPEKLRLRTGIWRDE